MDKDYFIKLTLAVYRVTELFPEKEPLKFSLREKANQVLADSILFFSKNPTGLAKSQEKEIRTRILRNIEILQGYFKIAETQQWIDEKNFFVLEKEYDKMKERIKGEEGVELQVVEKSEIEIENKESPKLPFDDLRRERCKKILEFLKKKEKAQIWEFKKIFPKISKRTLRRDFEYLLAKSLVERVGEGKWTYYRIK
jgi:hypothetical protein